EWARAAAGAVVVGARAAAWAPVAPLGRVVVLDEHDEVYQQEQSPTWHARDVVTERARRSGAPCLLVSPCPSLEALAWGTLVVPSRAEERRGWPTLTVVDQRTLDPQLGPLFSPSLVDLLRSPGRVLCVLNRTGRARLLACSACATLVRCEACDAAVAQLEPGTLTCARCGTERPPLCLACGGTKLKNLRLGVSRAREELEALAGEPVAEVAGAGGDDPPPDDRIVIGTEAVLHRVPSADAVAFLDFDQELLAPRYRAAEEALALLARAARVVRGRETHGRVLIQTRTPDHPVLTSALHADPGRLVTSERPMREVLRLPPAWALAEVSGAAAPAFVEALGRPAGLEVQGPVDGTWRVRAVDHATLCDALGAVPRPPGRLRLAVDPLRS
ncbi:MAG: priA, partial [Acidimicrobiales bacterium]|nr:priA [Acidimicrobiales bacterium]